MVKKIIALSVLLFATIIISGCSSRTFNLANCCIVYSVTDGEDIKLAAEELRDAIGKQEITLTGDVSEQTPNNEYEILIGNTNRAESIKYTRNPELYYLDYVIRRDGNKIVIIGGSNKATLSAVEYFIDTLIADGKTSFKDYSYKHEYKIKTLTVDDKYISNYNAITTATDGSYDTIVKDFCNRFTELTGFKQSSESGALNILIKCDKELPPSSYQIKVSNGDITFAGANTYGVNGAINTFFDVILTSGTSLKNGDSFVGNIEIDQTKFDAYINRRTPLYNTYYKLMTEKELNVVYFGGSVTDGHGASDAELTSWRGLVSSWLSSTFPNAKINNFGASVSGSGSHLGAFRCTRDVVAIDPDLVFVEFAMNDAYCGTQQDQIKLYYESIIRQIKQARPDCDIIALYTVDQGSASDTVLPPPAIAQDEVASAYNVTSINLGGALCSTINYKSDTEWKNYFIDIVHPSDAGHTAYFETIREYLETELVYGNARSDEIKSTTLPHILNEDDFTPKYITTDKMDIVDNKGWELNESSYWSTGNPYPGYYTSSSNNNSLTIRFKGGSNIALFAQVAKNRVYYSVDGGSEKIYSSGGNHPHLLAVKLDGDSETEHTVTLHIKNKGDTPFVLSAILVW